MEELNEEQTEKKEIYYSVLLDDEGYYNGQYWIGSEKLLDGTPVESLPPEEREQYWSAYRYIDEEWVFDPNKASEIANEVELSLKKENIQLQMQAIKDELNELDVKTMKYVDGILSEEDYEPFKIRKADLRKMFNELEEELEKLGE